ncbi:MAG: hypothetical protein NXH72_11920 [Hyphomonadaceae bacterium]|nr:hypothetical protein [Hyphomonadaceae bacterium]
MSDQNLPKDSDPLTPWGYWQESLKAWSDFSQRTSQILMNQSGQSRADRGKPLDPEADTLASELLRSYSDLNLRHWQNTARFLEGLPSWMQTPNIMTGSALVDWFDNFQPRSRGASQATANPIPEGAMVAPETLPSPKGKADDLTRIKGIGPKLSARLNELGIYHFKQIAGWSEPEALWVDEFLSFKGRVARENWISQARVLSANGSTTLH